MIFHIDNLPLQIMPRRTMAIFLVYFYRFSHTPTKNIDAFTFSFRHFDVIKLLRNAGGHLLNEKEAIGSMLCA